MPVLELLDVPAAVPPRAALLGLDLGTKTIGVGVGDIELFIASPLVLIRRSQFTAEAEQLFKLMAERRAAGLVIGLPVNMDGSEGSRAQSARAFGRNLLRLRPGLPVTFWDERLSSVAVNRTLVGEADLSRAKRAEVVDRAAAAYILQGALDRLRSASR